MKNLLKQELILVNRKHIVLFYYKGKTQRKHQNVKLLIIIVE